LNRLRSGRRRRFGRRQTARGLQAGVERGDPRVGLVQQIFQMGDLRLQPPYRRVGRTLQLLLKLPAGVAAFSANIRTSISRL
jgi:hypothetical protein